MIGLHEARVLLEMAMETQGRDFVYGRSGEHCFYEPRNSYKHFLFSENDNRRKTGCLIGVALDFAGETRHHGMVTIVVGIHLTYPDMLSEDAMHYFQIAQNTQDIGVNWGRCYDAAEEYLNQLK